MIDNIDTDRALWTSESRLKAFIEHSNQLYYSHTPDYVVKYISPQCRIFLDCEPEEAMVKGAEFFTDHPVNAEGLRLMKMAVETAERQPPYMLELVGKKGRKIWVEVNESPVVKEGKTVAVIGALTDITKQKMNEEFLRKEKEKFRTLVEESPVGVSLIGEDGRYIYINPKFIRLFGYTLEDCPTGKDWFRMAYPSPEYRNRVVKTWLRDKEGSGIGEVRPRIFTVTCKDGSEKLINFRPVTLESGEQLTIYEDVTYQKKLEAHVRHVKNMELLGTLSGGIANKFNNLLMGILGNTTLALMNKSPEHPDYRKLKNIEELVQKGTELTKKLMAYVASGKDESKPTNINDLIEKTIQTFTRMKNNIKVITKYQANVFTVEVDRMQIEHVMSNLFMNAWKAMPCGGDIYVRTENVVLDWQFVEQFASEPGNYVKISVTDTGIGMDKETQLQIFNPLFTTKEICYVTGLPSSYSIIENHGGIITVHSKVGHGSTFTIYLPESEQKVKKEEISMKPNETILLADDEEMILEVGAEMLEILGYKVLPASCGKDAVEIFAANKERINMVILDMIMPDMGGEEVFNQIKKIKPDIKVLLSSGYSIEKQRIRHSCNGFIQKPFNLKNLSEKIKEILGSADIS